MCFILDCYKKILENCRDKNEGGSLTVIDKYSRRIIKATLFNLIKNKTAFYKLLFCNINVQYSFIQDNKNVIGLFNCWVTLGFPSITMCYAFYNLQRNLSNCYCKHKTAYKKRKNLAFNYPLFLSILLDEKLLPGLTFWLKCFNDWLRR